MKDLLLLLRPHQWVKNCFVFLPLFFNGDLNNLELFLDALVAFVAFCLIASSIYCFNDIYDVEADRKHPQKRMRPIASGKVSVSQAYCLMGILFLGSILVVCLGLPNSRLETMSVLTLYFWMNIAYCVRLKNIALLDVFVIAVGFVLRILIGGMACKIMLSHWIILMTFLLALFLAFAKRRDDVVLYQETGVLPRKNVNRYNLDFMNQAITVISAVTMVAYVMYTVSDEVMERFGSRYVYLTTVFVLAGILRYMQITIVDVKSGSPTKVLMKDHFVQFCILGWIFAFLILIYIAK